MRSGRTRTTVGTTPARKPVLYSPKPLKRVRLTTTLLHLSEVTLCVICRKRCFISNLSFKTSWQDLKDKFREVGNVVYANVTRDENGEGSARSARLTVIHGFP